MNRKFIQKYIILYIINIIILIFSILFDEISILLLNNFYSLFLGISFLNELRLITHLRFNFFYWGNIVTLIATNIGGIIQFLFSFSLEDYKDYLIYNKITLFYLGIAHLYILIFSVILFLLSVLINNKIKKIILLVYKNRINYAFLIYFILFILIIQIYLVAIGFVGFMGTSYGARFTDQPIYILIAPLIYGICFANGVLISKIRHLNKIQILILIISVATELVWFFFWGRRMIVLSILITMIGFFGINQIVFKWKNILIFLLIYIFISGATSFFFFLRDVNISSDRRSFTVAELEEMLDKLNNADKSILENKQRENIKNRFFLMTTFPQLIKALNEDASSSFALGESIMSHILISTPGDIIIEKSKVISADYLYNIYVPSFYDANEFDAVSTIYIEGYLDYGLIGVVIAPLLLGIISFLFLNLAIRADINFMFFLIGNFLYQYLSIGEASLSTYFVEIRNLFAIFILYHIAIYLFKYRRNVKI